MYSQAIPDDSLYFGQAPPGDTAVLFAPGIVSIPNRFQSTITFSPDGKECCFSIKDAVYWSWATILYAKYENNEWSDFTPATFTDTTNYFDIAPFFSPDGQKFLFSSARPSKAYNYVDLWMCQYSNGNWSTPVKLDASINDPDDDESCSSLSNSGNIYFNKDKTGSIWVSYYKNGAYGKAVKIDKPINPAGRAFIAPDESYMLFSANRPEGYGQSDLYISFRRIDSTWTNAKNLGPGINSIDNDSDPRISPDGKYLFFTRGKKGVYSDMYWVRARFIDSLKYTNFTPYLKSPIPDQIDTLGNLFNYIVPDSTFIDDDGNNTLTYSAILSNGLPLPSWLLFDPTTRAFSGIPVAAETLTIKITAADTATASASTTFKISITNPTSIEEYKDQLPKKMQLLQNYPNPFNPSTTIHYTLAKSSCVKLTIIGLLGQNIRTLQNAFQQAGEYFLVWDATDERNIPVSSGMYFYRLEADNLNIQKKMIVVR